MNDFNKEKEAHLNAIQTIHDNLDKLHPQLTKLMRQIERTIESSSASNETKHAALTLLLRVKIQHFELMQAFFNEGRSLLEKAGLTTAKNSSPKGADDTCLLRIIESWSGSLREIIVPRNINLLTLHHVMQAAYNWEKCHLFDYELPGNRFLTDQAPIDFGEIPEESFFEEYHLNDVLTTKKGGSYVYDLGDYREHKFTILLNRKHFPCWTCVKVEGPDQLENHGGNGRTPTPSAVTKRLAKMIKK